MFDFDHPAEDAASLLAWLAQWDPLVAAVDFVPARALFAPNVAAFGTYAAEVMESRQRLEDEQWRQVWPTIDDFKFDLQGMKTALSADRCMGLIMVNWTSTGYHQDGQTFCRPGRATVVLTRPDLAQPWCAIHSHFSLLPGTPGKSHGNRPARS